MKLRPGPQLVDQVEPGALVACQPVDEHHRNPPRLVWFEKLEPRLRVGAPEGLDEALEPGTGHARQHVEQRYREIRRQVRPRGPDLDRRDLHRIRQVEHRRGVVSCHGPDEGFDDVVVAGHVEPQHGRRRDRLPIRRVAGVGFTEPPGIDPHSHRQPEAIAQVAPREPLVVGLRLRLKRGDRLDGHRERLRHERHLHEPSGRADPHAAVGDASVAT